MNRREFIFGCAAVFATCVASAAPSWIWYPGDFEVYLAQEVQERRLEWGGVTPVMWPQYHHYPLVSFSKVFTPTNDCEMTVRIDGEGCWEIWCKPGEKAVGQRGCFHGEKTTIPLKAANGRHKIVFLIVNSKRLPAIYVTGPGLESGADWLIEHSNSGTWTAAATDYGMTDPKRPPSDFALATRPKSAVSSKPSPHGGLLADFGGESFGYLKLRGVRGKGRVKIVYAESEKEALADGIDNPALGQRDDLADVWEVVEIAAADEIRLEKSRAFRYVNVIPLDAGVTVAALAMDDEYLPLETRGAFTCDDERLNEIWRVAERTMRLTTREFFLDGLKRDRWVWCGDALQSELMYYYLYADEGSVRRTIRALRGKDPVWRHVNTIVDYTFYWFALVDNLYLYSGDAEFVGGLYPSMKTLMDFVESRISRGDGFYTYVPNDWVFIDWASEPLANTAGPVATIQILLARAYRALADAARLAGDAAGADAYAAKERKVRETVKPVFWSAERGGLVHAVGSKGEPLAPFTRYANIFGILNGYFDDRETESVLKNCLLNDKVMKIQTPYMRFYELDALCTAGRHDLVLKEMRSYWGGMLDLGADTFWELYNPAETGDQHLAMYGRNFGRSRCHAWGASPAYLLGRHFLGVRPTKPGFAEYVVEPHLGGLKWMKGRVPTPLGDIEVEVRDGRATVKGNRGRGTLVWNGETHDVIFEGQPRACASSTPADRNRLEGSARVRQLEQ